jgi:hypothetical protein
MIKWIKKLVLQLLEIHHEKTFNQEKWIEVT